MGRSQRRWAVFAAAIALVAAACSSTGGDEASSTTVLATTQAPATTVATDTTVTAPTTTQATTTTVVADEAGGIEFVVETALPFVEAGGEDYSFETVDDNSGMLTVELPSAWSDVSGTPWEEPPIVGLSIVAAESLDTFFSDFSAPGIFVGASDDFAPGMDGVDPIEDYDFSSACTSEGAYVYRHPATDSDGFASLWSDCGDTSAAMVVTGTMAPGNEYGTIVIGIVRTEADLDAYANALETVTVTTVAPGALDPAGVVDVVAAFAFDAGPPPEYVFDAVEDETGEIIVAIPESWAERDLGAWENNGQDVGPGILASTSLEGFLGSWDSPGMFFGISEDLASREEPRVLLDAWDFSEECANEGRFPFSNDVYSGRFDIWSNCGASGTVYVVVEAYEPFEPAVALIEFQLGSNADLPVLEMILNSFGETRG